MKNVIQFNHSNNLLLKEPVKKFEEIREIKQNLPQILFITSFPPRECGIATYSQDLIKALENKFNNSFGITICPLESTNEHYNYPEEIKFSLNIDKPKSFKRLAQQINQDADIQVVMIQHEFGLFRHKEDDLIQFVGLLHKPVSLVFHTVLPNPNGLLRFRVQQIADICETVVVMTQTSKQILVDAYGIEPEKISVISHGTHLVPHSNRGLLKEKYQLTGKKILSTFGLLSSGKSIETTLNALPNIIKNRSEERRVGKEC